MGKRLVIGNVTDPGKVRSSNQDYFASYEGRFGTLVTVCDGMGGHEGGEIASRLAVEVIRDHFLSLDGTFDIRTELRRSLMAASKTILERAKQDPALHNMGTTAVILVVQGNVAYTAHVGDSRIYLIHGTKAIRLTKDHSLVQRMIDAKMITEAESRDHPKKNVIDQALGAGKTNIDPTVSEPIPIFRNDRFLLCSDGLTSYITEQELASRGVGRSPQSFCELLVRLANDRGGEDNITVQIVEVRKGKRRPIDPAARKNLLRYAAGVGIGALVMWAGYQAWNSGVFGSAGSSNQQPAPAAADRSADSTKAEQKDSTKTAMKTPSQDSSKTTAGGVESNTMQKNTADKSGNEQGSSLPDTTHGKDKKANGNAH
jgi:serine/threonine protein phosphatase PrpC